MPSDHFHTIQRKLEQRPIRFWRRLEHLQNALSEVKELPVSERLAITHPLLNHKDGEVRLAAQSMFRDAFRQASETDVEHANDIGYLVYGFSENNISPENVKKHSVLNERPLFWQATYASSGYSRELSLVELSKDPEPLDWLFALDCLNDWVPQVREKAELLCEGLLQRGFVGELVRWPNTLSRLVDKRRAGNHAALSGIILQLSKEGLVDDLWPNWKSPLRAFALETLAERGVISEKLQMAVMQQTNMKHLRLLLQRLDDNQIQASAKTSNSRVRLAALEEGLRRSLFSNSTFVVDALQDPSVGVRTSAQFYLSKAGMNVQAHYRTLLNESSAHQPHVLRGLSDVATKDDLETLRSAYVMGDVTTRVSIAKALIRLEDSSFMETLIADPNNKVRYLAMKAILKNSQWMDADTRLRVFQSTTPRVRKVGAKLLMHQSRWESILWILKLITFEGTELQVEAKSALTQWLDWADKRPSVPSQEALGRVQSALEPAKAFLHPKELATLYSALDWSQKQLSR